MSDDHYTHDTELEFYPIVVGLTRPSTFKGVPLQFAAFCAMIVGLVFIFSEDLRVLLAYPVLHAIGYALQVWDHRFIDICFLKMRKGWFVKNFGFWGGNSYSP